MDNKEDANAEQKIINQKYADRVTLLKENPFAYISKQTTRAQLFKICYLLEREQIQLKQKFENAQKKVQGITNTPSNTNTALQFQIKLQNTQFKVQNSLFRTYSQQLQQIHANIKKKEERIKQLKSKHSILQGQFDKIMERVRISGERVLVLQEKKKQYLQKAKVKKQAEKMGKELVDQLMGEYYNTLQDVIENQKQSY